MLSKKILLKRILPALLITSIALTLFAFFILKNNSNHFDKIKVNFTLETVHEDKFTQD